MQKPNPNGSGKMPNKIVETQSVEKVGVPDAPSPCAVKEIGHFLFGLAPATVVASGSLKHKENQMKSVF